MIAGIQHTSSVMNCPCECLEITLDGPYVWPVLPEFPPDKKKTKKRTCHVCTKQTIVHQNKAKNHSHSRPDIFTRYRWKFSVNKKILHYPQSRAYIPLKTPSVRFQLLKVLLSLITEFSRRASGPPGSVLHTFEENCCCFWPRRLLRALGHPSTCGWRWPGAWPSPDWAPPPGRYESGGCRRSRSPRPRRCRWDRWRCRACWSPAWAGWPARARCRCGQSSWTPLCRGSCGNTRG